MQIAHRDIPIMPAAPRALTTRVAPAPLAPLALAVPAAPTVDPLQPVGSPGRVWQEAAARRAGFDLASWRPERGFSETKRYVWGGYEYYRRMQVEHPELLWAGMAFGIGPTFAAGLQDLAVFNRWIGALEREPSLLPTQPDQDALERARELAGVSSISQITRDLEQQLLRMQQAIFLDQGMQHEAYLGGGMHAIRELAATGAIDAHAVDAWQQISDGARTNDRASIERGNLELLRREQMQTIAANYDQIRRLTLVSPLVTYVLTALGRPSIPGSRRPSQVMPVHVGPIALPIPALDISRANDRWAIIERDTWPAFARLTRDRPTDYRAMLATSLDQRIAAGHYRYLPDSASVRDIARFVSSIVRHRHSRGIADELPADDGELSHPAGAST